LGNAAYTKYYTLASDLHTYILCMYMLYNYVSGIKTYFGIKTYWLKEIIKKQTMFNPLLALLQEYKQ